MSKKTVNEALNKRDKLNKDAFIEKLNGVNKSRLGLGKEDKKKKPVPQMKRRVSQPAGLKKASNKKNSKNRANKPRKVTPLKIVMLGGLNEIGKNMTVLEYRDEIIVVDCGMSFPDNDQPGIDAVIPDTTYLADNIEKIKGIVITHGHEDHIGALQYVLKSINVPVYATKMTLGILESRLAEHGIKNDVTLNCIKPGDTIKLGVFSVEFINVNHSIPDSVALAIKTPVGMVVHTGDFKIDSTPTRGEMIDLTRFGELGKNGVLALLMDSTNAERPGYTLSEQRVSQSLENIFRGAAGKRIIITTFASNIYRIQQIINISFSLGRKVALSGRSMVNNIALASDLGYIDIPKDILIDISLIDKYKSEDIVIITTGSQGEDKSALYRIAFSDHKQIVVSPNDLIIFSSNPIPGNEKLVTKVVNELLKQGCSVIYESLAEIHASGHACQDELKIMLGLVKPKYYIPVHGEYKHLKKAEALGISMGVSPENILINELGKIIELRPDSIAINGEVPTGSVFVDGLSVGDVGNTIMAERLKLSRDGVIVVTTTISKKTGELLEEPRIISRGFVYVPQSEELFVSLKEVINDCVSKNKNVSIHDVNALKGAIENALAKCIKKSINRSPVILSEVIQK